MNTNPIKQIISIDDAPSGDHIVNVQRVDGKIYNETWTQFKLSMEQYLLSVKAFK